MPHKRQPMTSQPEFGVAAMKGRARPHPDLTMPTPHGPVEESRTQLGIRMRSSKHSRLKMLAAKRRVTIQDLIEHAVDKLLADAGEDE